jgi:hypothetical protein
MAQTRPFDSYANAVDGPDTLSPIYRSYKTAEFYERRHWDTPAAGCGGAPPGFSAVLRPRKRTVVVGGGRIVRYGDYIASFSPPVMTI